MSNQNNESNRSMASIETDIAAQKDEMQAAFNLSEEVAQTSPKGSDEWKEGMEYADGEYIAAGERMGSLTAEQNQRESEIISRAERNAEAVEASLTPQRAGATAVKASGVWVLDGSGNRIPIEEHAEEVRAMQDGAVDKTGH